MADKKMFERLKKEMQKSDEEREKIILKSREIVATSKKVIYSTHRGEPDQKALSEIKKQVQEIKKIVKENPDLQNAGAYKVALQEYVEALTLNAFMNDKKLLTDQDLGVDAEHYLLGLCDLSGELTRVAINSAIKGNYKAMKDIKDFVQELYEELSQFDFRNSELRKKYDQIKWSLEKLEEALFQLTVKGKI